MAFPQFNEPKALDDRRAWTARYESFDQRKDDVYYTIRLLEDGVVTSVFIGMFSYWDRSWTTRRSGSTSRSSCAASRPLARRTPNTAVRRSRRDECYEVVTPNHS